MLVNPEKTAAQCGTLFAATLVVGGAGYFASKTVIYLGKGAKNLGSKFLKTHFGQLVAWPFQKIWAAMRSAGSGIKSAFFWCWSCMRHPITSLQNLLKNIWTVACFIFNWTIGITYTSIQSFLNNYMPSLKPPLTAAATSGLIALGLEYIPINRISDKTIDRGQLEIGKAITVFVGTLFGAFFFSNRLTTSRMTKLHAAGWGVVNGAVYYALSHSGKLPSTVKKRRGQ